MKQQGRAESPIVQFDALVESMSNAELISAFLHISKLMERRGMTAEMQHVVGNRSATGTRTSIILTGEIEDGFRAITEKREGNGQRGRKAIRIEQVWNLFKEVEYGRVSNDKIIALMANRKEPEKGASSLISQINMLWRQMDINLRIHAETVRSKDKRKYNTVYWIGRPLKPSVK